MERMYEISGAALAEIRALLLEPLDPFELVDEVRIRNAVALVDEAKAARGFHDPKQGLDHGEYQHAGEAELG